VTKNDRGDLNDILEKISKIPEVETLLSMKDELIHYQEDLHFYEGGDTLDGHDNDHLMGMNLVQEKINLTEKIAKLEKKIEKASYKDYKLNQIVDILMKKDGSNCNLYDNITISQFLHSQF
jgi:hypothetical protein